MALLGLFDTSEVEAFAASLAEDLARRFPPAAEKRADRGATRQLASILDSIATRAERFRDERRLGLYRKAKLGNRFRWRLKELGYSEAFIENATNAIVTRVAMR